MNAVSSRGKRLPEFAAIGRPLWRPKGKKRARFFRPAADLGGSGPWRSQDALHRVTASRWRKPSREEERTSPAGGGEE